ncbi:MAG: hypothetical protein ACK2UJ_12240 [Candidatus Promineifilaceae bacterium]
MPAIIMLQVTRTRQENLDRRPGSPGAKVVNFSAFDARRREVLDLAAGGARSLAHVVKGAHPKAVFLGTWSFITMAAEIGRPFGGFPCWFRKQAYSTCI